MKFKVGDLAFYTSIAEDHPKAVEYSPFWLLTISYFRPNYLELALTAGIILECHNSKEMFLRTNKRFNAYIWQSQQTEQQLLVYECELTTADECAKMSSYGTSFISPLARTARSKKTKTRRLNSIS
jgi:hypothetical protein